MLSWIVDAPFYNLPVRRFIPGCLGVVQGLNTETALKQAKRESNWQETWPLSTFFFQNALLLCFIYDSKVSPDRDSVGDDRQS